MLGNSDDLRTKTENKQGTEPCYGGFQNRFSYERCIRNERSSRSILARILFFAGVVLLSLSFGLLCFAVLFRVVVSNSSLYYPNGSYLNSDSTASVLPMRAASKNEEADSSVSFLACVTREDSKRYRIPTGVMVRSVDALPDTVFSGLEEGDIITEVNGEEVLDVESLIQAIDGSCESDGAMFTVFRENGYVFVTADTEMLNKSICAE